MRYRKLDPNGDYSFGKGSQDFLINADAVAQAVKTNLLLFQGEWWEDISDGLPYFQSIVGQAGTTEERLNATDLLIKERILSTEGVTKIKDFQRTYENRKYAVSCTVETTTGQTASVEVSF